MPAKKRTTLDALISPADTGAGSRRDAKPSPTKKSAKKPAPVVKSSVPDKAKGAVVKSSMYIPEAVYEQLRGLAFDERKKVHDYIMEGIDRVFADRGLAPIAELTNQVGE